MPIIFQPHMANNRYMVTLGNKKELAALQSNGVFDPRGSRQISVQAWLLDSLFRRKNA